MADRTLLRRRISTNLAAPPFEQRAAVALVFSDPALAARVRGPEPPPWVELKRPLSRSLKGDGGSEGGKANLYA
jgi:hypothetical protein